MESIRIIRSIITIPFMLMPLKNNKVVICNYYGNGYGDNGKYIVEEIIRQGLDYDIVWLLKKDMNGKTEFPVKVRTVEYGSLRALFEMSTAKVWIDNCRKDFYPLKRKKQYYIQTWHSPLRLKKIEKDAEDKLSAEYIKMAKKDSKNIDLMISGCDFSWNIYRYSFWYKGDILKCGTPRCDLFFNKNNNIRKKVISFFTLGSSSKLILFAPTFRSNHNIDAYTLEYEEILNALEKRFGEEWTFLVRLHPNVSYLSTLIECNSKVVNATGYDDMQELLCAVDILITDYSSSMFDMAIAGKICFLHGEDVNDYLIKEREMYFSFDELPFAFSKTNKELIENILKFDETEYKNKLNNFFKVINLYETGNASQQLVEKIKCIK